MGIYSDALEKATKKTKTRAVKKGPAKKQPISRQAPAAGKPTPPETPTLAKPEFTLVDSPIQAKASRVHRTRPEPLFSENNIDPNLVSMLKPKSLEAEIFKIMRTNLLFPVQGTPPRTIMITSAVPGEGKSFVAANLAVNIAQGIEEHVLLMDCDMRRAKIHNMFGYGSITGLSDYLSNGTALESLLLKTSLDKLTLLAGGRSPHNPAELISSKKMSDLLKEVKSRYADRYVIIDSPPPRLTAESNAISRQVDGIILVVKAGKTPRDLVLKVVESLGREKILGVVMNQCEVRTSKYYGYGKYYGKGNS